MHVRYVVPTLVVGSRAKFAMEPSSPARSIERPVMIVGPYCCVEWVLPQTTFMPGVFFFFFFFPFS